MKIANIKSCKFFLNSLPADLENIINMMRGDGANYG